MINAYLSDNSFSLTEIKNLNEISVFFHKKKSMESIWKIPVKAIIGLLDNLGKSIMKNSMLNKHEGVSYLCLWLRKKNLLNLTRLSLGNENFLNEFIAINNNQWLIAQPRGIVCHWIAGNILTLSMFSLVQSLITKNINIIKVPPESIDFMIQIMKILNDLEFNFNEKIYKGRDISIAVVLITYSSFNKNINVHLSNMADTKIIWGGGEAVKNIVSLPQKETCQTIVYGPKYSFCVFDKEFLSLNEIKEVFSNLVRDVIAFEQNGCSSPHVLFFEKGNISLQKIAEILKDCFDEISKKYPRLFIQSGVAYKILTTRARYYLDPEKNILNSINCDWTILIDNEIKLEEPVGYRTIFIKSIDSFEQIFPLINKRIQTIGIGIKNHKKRKNFCMRASFLGVDRFVKPGMMNNIETPWDGMMMLSRLVRWVSYKGDDFEKE